MKSQFIRKNVRQRLAVANKNLRSGGKDVHLFSLSLCAYSLSISNASSSKYSYESETISTIKSNNSERLRFERKYRI